MRLPRAEEIRAIAQYFMDYTIEVPANYLTVEQMVFYMERNQIRALFTVLRGRQAIWQIQKLADNGWGTLYHVKVHPYRRPSEYTIS